MGHPIYNGEPVIENIFLRNTVHSQIRKDQKRNENLSKRFLNLLESDFSICRISSNCTWSSIKTEKARTMKTLGNDT